ncbi:unnamed protein product [Lathyrus oleraceus]
MDVTELRTNPVSLEIDPESSSSYPPPSANSPFFFRLPSVGFEDAFDLASEVNVHERTVNNEYHIVHIVVWTAHLHGGLSVENIPRFDQMTALVMVFDMNDLPSLAAFQDHPLHVRRRRRLLKLEGPSANEFSEHGISEFEGISLLGNEEPSCSA